MNVRNFDRIEGIIVLVLVALLALVIYFRTADMMELRKRMEAVETVVMEDRNAVWQVDWTDGTIRRLR